MQDIQSIYYWIALLTPETPWKHATPGGFLEDRQPYLTSELLSLCLQDDRLSLVSTSASLFALLVTSGECLAFLISISHHLSRVQATITICFVKWSLVVFRVFIPLCPKNESAE